MGGHEIVDDVFDMVMGVFDMTSEQFWAAMVADSFPGLAEKTGAGRAGWGCSIATDGTLEASERGGIPSSSCM